MMQPHSFLFLILVLSPFILTHAAKYRPVVMMHGIAASRDSMINVVNWISEAFPGIYVKNVEIGNGYESSFFTNMNKQVESMCQQLASDPNLQEGFNLIGYSQGSLITRGFIERCNSPPVYNYITWSGPHAGEFGIPDADWKYLVEIVASTPYEKWVQDSFTFAQYWKDSYNMADYLNYSTFLADINNERQLKNQTYRKNIMGLNNMVLLYSTVDTIIIPKTSGWFEFFAPNSENTVIPLKDSDFYKDDWLGLKYLDDSGRLNLYSCNCQHPDYPEEVCRSIFNKYTLPYLNNTF